MRPEYECVYVQVFLPALVQLQPLVRTALRFLYCSVNAPSSFMLDLYFALSFALYRAEVRSFPAFRMPRAGVSINRDPAMQQLERRLATLEVDHQFVAIIATMFSYCEENMTASSIPEFKNELISRYSETRTVGRLQHVFCMITGVFLPKPWVIASHIWKRAWHLHTFSMMGFENINDPRNGLLLFKPFEWAFDVGKICFLPDSFGEERLGNYCLHILDPDLRDMTLRSCLQCLLQKRNARQPQGHSQVCP